MGSDSKVNDAPAIMREHEKDKKQPEGCPYSQKTRLRPLKSMTGG